MSLTEIRFSSVGARFPPGTYQYNYARCFERARIHACCIFLCLSFSFVFPILSGWSTSRRACSGSSRKKVERSDALAESFEANNRDFISSRGHAFTEAPVSSTSDTFNAGYANQQKRSNVLFFFFFFFNTNSPVSIWSVCFYMSWKCDRVVHMLAEDLIKLFETISSRSFFDVSKINDNISVASGTLFYR